MTPPVNRRDFLQATAATAALAAASTATSTAEAAAPRAALAKSATDKVMLGKSGVKVSLVGMGTGSVGSGPCFIIGETLHFTLLSPVDCAFASYTVGIAAVAIAGHDGYFIADALGRKFSARLTAYRG